MPDTQTADVIMRAGQQSSSLGRPAVICSSIHAWFRPVRCTSLRWSGWPSPPVCAMHSAPPSSGMAGRNLCNQLAKVPGETTV